MTPLNNITEMPVQDQVLLLIKAISDLAQQQFIQGNVLVDLSNAVTEQQKQIMLLDSVLKDTNSSIEKMGLAIDTMINQMFVFSRNPMMPPTFKGVFIK